MLLYVSFIAVLILIVSLCYDEPHTGFKFCIVSCPFRQTIKTRLLKVLIGNIKFIKPVPIIIPDKKGAHHIFCLLSLFCRHSIISLNPAPLPPCGKHKTRKRYSHKKILKIFRTEDVDKSLALITSLRRNPSPSTESLSSFSISQETPVSSARHSVASSARYFLFVDMFP